MSLRVLVLGGTTEASALARLLAGDGRFVATLSLAGRTAAPRVQPIPTRVGGFGGVAGLAAFLRQQAIDAVVDATHPYADQMSRHAVEACRTTGVALVSIVRPPWPCQQGDAWQVVTSADAAAATLGATPRHVFLSLGRQELQAFAAAPQHRYLARVIDPPLQAGLPPDLTLLSARGPFDREAELRLLKDRQIEVVVSKNAGGTATYAKIVAARELGLPVVMIARPDKPAGRIVASPEEAMASLAHDGAPRSLRGV